VGHGAEVRGLVAGTEAGAATPATAGTVGETDQRLLRSDTDVHGV